MPYREMSMKQYYVLIGNFGSGKSEISLNLAMNSVKSGKTVLVDLDIVNPYFRSVERKDELEQAGVKVHYPVFALTTVDVPSLPPDIYSVFVGDYETVVFDVGGDPAGATAIGQYRTNFQNVSPENLHVLYIINQRRPLAETPELVLEMFGKIQSRSRLPITGFINNTNLSQESSAEDLLAGYELLREVCAKTGIPVKYTTGVQAVMDEFLAIAKEKNLDQTLIGEPKVITRYMRRDWSSFTEKGV